MQTCGVWFELWDNSEISFFSLEQHTGNATGGKRDFDLLNTELLKGLYFHQSAS